jgi:hypothetical protein
MLSWDNHIQLTGIIKDKNVYDGNGRSKMLLATLKCRNPFTRKYTDHYRLQLFGQKADEFNSAVQVEDAICVQGLPSVRLRSTDHGVVYFYQVWVRRYFQCAMGSRTVQSRDARNKKMGLDGSMTVDTTSDSDLGI